MRNMVSFAGPYSTEPLTALLQVTVVHALDV